MIWELDWFVCRVLEEGCDDVRQGGGGGGGWRGQVLKKRQSPDFWPPKGWVYRGTGSFLGVVDGSRVQSPNDLFESKQENT